MRLLNPWALLGVLAIAAPIAAHLLARRPARHLRFPNLRFLPATRPSPVHRERLSEIALLILRCAIVAVAAFALAQPVWLTPDRARDLGAQIARAIIVDSSASMSRPAGRDGRAIDVARTRAAATAADATSSRSAEAAEPASAIPAAVNWLMTQPMRRELVVVSDFQSSSIDKAQLAGVPDGIGIRLIAVPAAGSAAAEPAGTRELLFLGSAAERDGAAAALAAAVSQGAPARLQRDQPIAIVFPDFETRAALLKRAAPTSAVWMADLITRVTSDPLVAAAAERAGRLPTERLTATGDTAENERLLVFVDASSHSLFSAAVISAVLHASTPQLTTGEAVTTSYSTDDLHRWERPAGTVDEIDPSRASEWSDARWFWAFAAALLLVETVVRRRHRPAASIAEEGQARVA